MLVISNPWELSTTIQTLKQKGKKLGLVPTMGALHQGHTSLIKAALNECDEVIVSIFVNPLQFSPEEDLEQYPRPLEADCQICEQLGVAVVFNPIPAELSIKEQPQAILETTQVYPPSSMTSGLCGKYRPNHFTGVATIVTKLLNLIQPDCAFFGQKDAQQLAIIRRLVADLNLPVQIVGCPIIREDSGLALSSRNQYLTPPEKQAASNLYSSLQLADLSYRQGTITSETLIKIVTKHLQTIPNLKIQYIEIVDPSTLQPLTTIQNSGLLAIAAYVGSTRLIDNIILD